MPFARRDVLIGMGLLGLGATTARSAVEQSEAGSVLTANGVATGELAGARRPLAAGAPVFISEILTTGAEARLAVRLGTTTQLSLGERTRIRIDRFLIDRGGELVLGRGAFLFDRPSDPPAGPLEVRTPFGLIAARGTRFFAGPVDGIFGVYVEHGVVTVRTRKGSVSLGEGLGTKVRSIDALPTEPKVWTRKSVFEAMASVG
jgi:ferric-dicitrate binding protein FerR (iron transport regulator)